MLAHNAHRHSLWSALVALGLTAAVGACDKSPASGGDPPAPDIASAAAVPDDAASPPSTPAPAAPAVAPEAAAPPPPVKVTTVEGITEWTLGNGLRVLLFPVASQTNVTVNVTYMVGSRHEGYGETGMAHLLEHMMFKGTPDHPEIWKDFQQRGAEFNGTTDYDRTNYYETFTATDDNLAWALDLEADRMVNSKIAAVDLATEFSVVRNEFEKDENDSASILSERILSTAYLWHNYGKSPIGSRSDIERVPVERLRPFYEKFYQPDNAVLVVSGKIDPDKTLALVNERFGKIPRPTRQLSQSYTVEPVQDGERLVTLQRVGDTQIVGVAYHTVAGSDELFPAVEALAYLLTDEPSGRLYTSLVATGLATRVWSQAQPLAEPGTLMLFAEVAGDKPVAPVRDGLIALVEGLRDPANAPTDTEVGRAKAAFAKAFDLMMTDNEHISYELSDWQALGDWRLMFLHRDRVAKLDAATVARATAFLVPSNRTLGLFVPTQEPMRAPEAGRPDVAAVVGAYVGQADVAQGEAFAATTANIESHVQRSTIGGVKLALLPKATRGAAVRARMTLHFASEAALAGRMDATLLLSEMLMRGTAKHSYQEINDELDRLKAQVSFDTEGAVPKPGQLSVRIVTTREHFAAVLALVGELLRESSFPEAEFETVRAGGLALLGEAQTDPQMLAITAAIRKLMPYGPENVRYVATIPESIEKLKALTVADVKRFHAELMGASNAELAVVGDFDPKAVEAFVTSTLAPWQSPVPFERVAMPYQANTEGVEVIDTPDKEGGFVLAVQRFQMQDTDPDYPAWRLFNFVLGGGAGSRLLERLRQKEGWSYGAFSQLQASPLEASGALLAGALVNPQNAKRALDALIEETNKLLKEGVSEEELSKAQAASQNAFETTLADDDWVAEKLMAGLFTDRTLAWEQGFNDALMKVTAADLVRVLGKGTIDPQRFGTVIAADQKKAATE